MCEAPSEIYVNRGWGYEAVYAPCKECWQCRARIIDDYTGRALAEAWASDWTETVTLTYAPRDDLADKIITKPHLQNFIRACKKSGPTTVRYLACGEYGALKGRAHFHVVLFGTGPRIEIPKQGTREARTWPSGVNFHHQEVWPHGHMFADRSGSESSIRYITKYLAKDKETRRSHWFTCSKQPPLGDAFFKRKADECIRFGVLPNSFLYSPPGGKADGQYMMTGVTRRNYLARIFDGLLMPEKHVLAIATHWVTESLKKTRRWQHEQVAIEPIPIDRLVEDIQRSREDFERVFNSKWRERFEARHGNQEGTSDGP